MTKITLKSVFALLLSYFLFLQINAQTATPTPSSANQGESLTVSISGQNTTFQQGTGTVSVFFHQGSSTLITPNSTTVNSDTEINCDFGFGYAYPTGFYDLSIVHPPNPDIFTPTAFFLGAGSNPPMITAIYPDTAHDGQALTVGISGQNTHFGQATNTMSVWFSQGSQSIYSYDIHNNNDTFMEADVLIPTGVSLGSYDVNVHNSVDGYLLQENWFVILPMGLGNISGSVIQGSNKVNGPGDPVIGLPLALIDYYSGNQVSTDVTDNQGGYTFINVPFGKYVIEVLDPLFPNENPPQVTLSYSTDIEELTIAYHTDHLETIQTNRENIVGFFSDFEIGPNPFQDQIGVSFKLQNTCDVQMKIIDINGNVVATKSNKNAPVGVHSIHLNSSDPNFPVGIYFIEILAGEQSSRQKILKIK